MRPSAADRDPGSYWSEPSARLLEQLQSSASGLDATEASARLARYGPNSLQRVAGTGALRLYAGQFGSPLVLILIGASAVSLVAAEWVDAGVVLAVVFGSTILGFLQEYIASHAIEQLRSRVAIQSVVMRGGVEVALPSARIVPGDVVRLSAGSLIPADAVVLEAKDFFVSQAVLTGETFPVEKMPGAVAATAGLAERTNCVFMGTSVRSGTAQVLVAATGKDTTFGQIAGKLALRAPLTDFERGIQRFGYLLTRIMLIMVTVVLAVNIFMAKPPIASLLFALALAVGLTPELLPAIVSVTLSHGARRMARLGVIVRRLNSIENLGSMDVLCTDKTGTLTAGVVLLDGAVDLEGQPDAQVLRLACINARLQTGLANPLDEAVRTAADKAGVDQSAVRKVDEIPYDFVRKSLSVVAADAAGVRTLMTKGALANVLGMCESVRDGVVVAPLDAAVRARIETRYDAWSTQGFRVLGVASRAVEVRDGSYSRADEAGMCFEGFLLFLDPPKEDVRQTLAGLTQRGVQLKMVTGDNHKVARHIALAIGLPVAVTLTGADLNAMSDEALLQAAQQATVFAEVDPNQKERIILALRKSGHVVGYMGDGINDAPALHSADVGISVDTAVDVAKDAADFVLLRKDLAILRAGIDEGRMTFANTLKYILTTVSANFGNMFSMAAASVLLPFLPLLASQILLNNFLADLPAATIASDNVDAAWMAKPRRWDTVFIRDYMVLFGLVSSAFDFLTFGALLWIFHAAPEEFRTGWFVESLLTELVIALVVRTRGRFWRSPPRAPAAGHHGRRDRADAGAAVPALQFRVRFRAAARVAGAGDDRPDDGVHGGGRGGQAFLLCTALAWRWRAEARARVDLPQMARRREGHDGVRPDDARYPMLTQAAAADFISWFETLTNADVPRVGGKNASLGEMVRNLAPAGVRVPPGFATTADAYRAYVAANEIAGPLRGLMEALDAGDATLHHTGEAARRLFLEGEFPAAIADEIREAYRALSQRSGAAEASVAVRSSATAEDLPDASFAGQQETFLNVRGERELLDACRRCYASLFTDRAISYRQAKGFDHLEVALSIGVQRMVRSDLGAAGVMFSIDTETGFPRAAVINANWGLGETVVQGYVDPDKYVVFKPLLADARLAPIIEKALGGKERKMVYASGGSARTATVATTLKERQGFALSDPEILQLARWAVAVEAHYGRAMDMEWAKDGETDELYLVQARPETVQSGRAAGTLRTYRLKARGKVLLTGSAIGEAVAAGTACVIRSADDIARFRDGAILVTEMTDPDWVPIMKRATGIVTDHGGTTSHAAIVSRELGVPAVVGTGQATLVVHDGDALTLSCAEGELGSVYEGMLPFETEDVDLSTIPRTRTVMMVNIASPGAAFRWWRLPARGVGLARLEFIVSNFVRAHPMALVQPERVADAGVRREIETLTRGHRDGSDYFVDTLSRGIAKLAAPFHPHPVIVRLSDFKTNEYAGLLGGAAFEPKEENPMIGWRGASRYYDPRYQPGFALECRALVRVREEMGFSNVIVMIPFCRTPEEADRVLAVMAAGGLRRGEAGLQIYMMCEVPSNVILAEQFATRFDGFSIGSNDLTQLVLGVDRDSADLARLFDERNEAVLRFVADAIARAHAEGIKIGICGQAPSNYPEFSSFLVKQGIDSISLNPDSFVLASRGVARAEAAMEP